MAEFLENMVTIRRAIYGKEIRPAIYQALLQNWEAVKTMMDTVDKLNARIDSLPGSGGGESGGGGSVDPDSPGVPIYPVGSSTSGPAAICVYSVMSVASVAGVVEVI